MAFGRSLAPSALLSRARLATAVFFFTNGAVIAILLPRLPQVKSSYALPDDIYGLAVAALPAGAIGAGLAAGWFARRFGAGRVAMFGTMVTASALVFAVLMPVPALFAALLAVAGAADAITDVAQNTHGLEVQRRYGRSIINGFHAIWSLGAVFGGLMAAGAIALAVPVRWHLFCSAVLCSGLAWWARRGCLPDSSEGGGAAPDHETSVVDGGRPADSALVCVNSVAHRWSRRSVFFVLLALVLIATAGAMVEDMANSWATLYLGRDLHAATQIAVLGFPAIVGAQFIGRLAGDPMVNRWGYRNVARFGATLIALGVGSAIAWPTIPVTLAGFAAAGFGSATLVPAAMHAADNLPHLRPGTGLTVVSWLMRLGFMLTAPTVGAIAAASSLRWGLSVVAVAGAVTVALAAVLPGRVKPADVLGSKHE